MKRIALLAGLVLLMLCLLPGCSEPSAPAATTAAPSTAPTQPPIPPQEQYDTARNLITQAPHQVLVYTATLQKSVSGNTFSQSVEGNASYSHIGTADMHAVVEEQLNLGGYTHRYTEAYCQRSAYAVVNDCYFRSDLTHGAFLDRQLPAVLITSSLYSKITLEEKGNTTAIHFSGATSLESWIPGADLQLISAFGTAELDSSGNLFQTVYEATYSQGDTRYTLSVSVRISTPSQLDLSAKHPAHEENCVQISELSAPRMLLQTVAQIYTANYISCQSIETIYSEAIPYAYSMNTEISISGFGEKLSAKAYYRSSASDYRGQIVSKEQVDTFRDGVFSTVINNGTPTDTSHLSGETIRQRLEDKILAGLLALKYLDNATAMDANGMLQLDLNGNTLFQKDVLEVLTSTLSLTIDKANDALQILALGGTLTIDRSSGLPIAMSLCFDMTHEKDGVPYRLTYQQEYTLSFQPEAQ